MDNHTFAITPAETDDDYFFASGAVGGAGAVTLLKTAVGTVGVAYKVTLYSTGDSSARTWTIVGKGLNNASDITEVLAAANAGTATSVNYFATITSITASGAMTGNQKIGFLGTSLVLSPVILHSVNWVSETSAGTIVINRNSTTGAELLKIHTPPGAGYDSLDVGRLRVRGGSAATDYAIMTLTTVTKVTLICG